MDSMNNIAVIGSYEGFSLKIGQNFESPPSYQGTLNIWIAKFDRNGAILWAQTSDGGSPAYARSVAVDSQNNVIVAGDFETASPLRMVIDLRLPPLESSGKGSDIFLLKFSSNGSALWAYSARSDQDCICSGVAIGREGAAYLAGHFKSHTGISFGGTELLVSDFIPNSLRLSRDASDDSSTIFLAKYPADGGSGSAEWVSAAGGYGPDKAYGIVTETSYFDGFPDNVYIAGSFSGSIYFDYGNAAYFTALDTVDMFVSKYDEYGNFAYVMAGGLYNANEKALAVAVERGLGPIVVGSFDAPTFSLGAFALQAGEFAS